MAGFDLPSNFNDNPESCEESVTLCHHPSEVSLDSRD
jgi:hypothetical protein